MNDVEVLAWGYGLVEGPRADADGNLFFSDVHKGGVYRRGPVAPSRPSSPSVEASEASRSTPTVDLVISVATSAMFLEGETRVVFAPDAPGLNDLFADPQGRVICGTIRSDPFLDRRSPYGGRVLADRRRRRCHRAVRRHLVDERHRVRARRNGALPLGHHPWRVGPRLRRRSGEQPSSLPAPRRSAARRARRRRGRHRLGRRRLRLGCAARLAADGAEVGRVEVPHAW